MPTSFNVLFLPKWYPNRNDPQLGVFIQKHARAIAEQDDVTVFYAHSDERQKVNNIQSEFYATGRLSEYIYYYKPARGFGSVIRNAIRYYSCWTRFKKESGIFHGKKPDILHAYILLRPAVLAYITLLGKRIPYIISEQWSGYATGKYRERTWMQRMLSRLVMRKAAAITSVSDFLKKKMSDFFPGSSIEIVYNVIEQTEKSEIVPETGKINMLIVADLVDNIKNISGVLDALADVSSTLPDYELHIIGHGRDKDKLMQLAQTHGLLDKKVFFDGLKNNSEVYAALHRCDFLIMNSRYETFSLICAEALSCGKPVIATRCGGPQEFITSDTGILIEPDNQSQLREAIQRMSTSFRSFDHFTLRQFALERFSASEAGKKFHRIYSEAIHHG